MPILDFMNDIPPETQEEVDRRCKKVALSIIERIEYEELEIQKFEKNLKQEMRSRDGRINQSLLGKRITAEKRRLRKSR